MECDPVLRCYDPSVEDEVFLGLTTRVFMDNPNQMSLMLSKIWAVAASDSSSEPCTPASLAAADALALVAEHSGPKAVIPVTR